MRKRILLVSVMAALPAMAGEVGVLLDKQFGQAQTATVAGGQKFDAVSPTGLGIRGGFDIIDLKVAALQLNATWHNKTTGDLTSNGTKLGELDNQVPGRRGHGQLEAAGQRGSRCGVPHGEAHLAFQLAGAGQQ